MNQEDPLARLRDLHVPGAPPDAGSPLAAVIVLTAICVAVLALAVWMSRRRGWRREALDMLSNSGGAGDAAMAGMAATLRRVALMKLGQPAAHLTGDAWLGVLDRLLSTDYFSAGRGRALGDALYAPPAGASVDADAIRRDLMRLLRRRRWPPW